MSAITTVNRKYLVAIASGLLMALLLVLGALQWAHLGGGGSRAEAPERPAGTVGAPRIEQARWKVHAAPAGTLSKPSKRAMKQFRAQRRPLGQTVRDIYNTTFLVPESAGDTVKQSFSKTASTAFNRLKLGLPRGAEAVVIKRRTARLAIDVAGARRATVRVHVIARGLVKEDRFGLEHTATLYLTRSSKEWRVVAFEVDQRPFRGAHHHKGQPEQRKDGRDGQGSKKSGGSEQRGSKDTKALRSKGLDR